MAHNFYILSEALDIFSQGHAFGLTTPGPPWLSTATPLAVSVYYLAQPILSILCTKQITFFLFKTESNLFRSESHPKSDSCQRWQLEFLQVATQHHAARLCQRLLKLFVDFLSGISWIFHVEDFRPSNGQALADVVGGR